MWSIQEGACPPTLCDPMDYSLQGPSVHGIFQARVLEWVAISFSRGYSQPRDGTQVSSLQADALPSELPGKPQYLKTLSKNDNLLKTKIVRATLNGFFNFLDNFSKYFLRWKQGLSKFSCCQVASAASNSL